MLARLILDYPDTARRLGVMLIVLLITVGLFQIGISSTWLGYLMPLSAPWVTDNPVAALCPRC
jgi:polar amino acid transport system permease protein